VTKKSIGFAYISFGTIHTKYSIVAIAYNESAQGITLEYKVVLGTIMLSCYLVTTDNMRETLPLATNNKEEKGAKINLIWTETWAKKKTSGYGTRLIPRTYTYTSASNKWCCTNSWCQHCDAWWASSFSLANKSRDHKISTKCNMCNHLKHWKDHYPDYYAIGICELMKQELTDPDKFFHNNQHDLVYSGLNV